MWEGASNKRGIKVQKGGKRLEKKLKERIVLEFRFGNVVIVMMMMMMCASCLSLFLYLSCTPFSCSITVNQNYIKYNTNICNFH